MSRDSDRPALHLPARYPAIVQDILRRYLPHAEVWAYGSRVNGDHHDASDLDLVVRQPDDLTRRQPDLDEVAAAFSDSDLPILVQIVDWARIPEAFREEIEVGYAVLQAAEGAPAAATDAQFLVPALQRGSVAGPLQRRVSSIRTSPPVRRDPGVSPLAPTLECESQKRAVDGGRAGAAREHPDMNDAVWNTVQFEDLAADSRNALVGGPFGSNLVSSDYTETGVPVIRGQNMGDGRWVIGPFAFVSEEKADSLRANLARPGDIVFTQRGTLGQVALVAAGPWDRYVVSQSQMKATLNPAVADPLFVYYYFTSPPEQNYIVANAIQTGVPHSNLGQLRAHPVRVPPLPEQRAIAAVLGALDDKIEQNRRTALALERLARAIFRAWFVDFEPVKAKAAGATAFPSMPQSVFDSLPTRFVDSDIGPVPEEWEVLPLDKLLTLQRGFDLPKQARTEGPYPILAASGVNGWHSDWKVKGPGVTTGRSGVLGRVFFVDRDFWPLNTSLWVKDYKRSNPWHAYFLLQTLELAQFNAGSAVPTLNRNHVHSLPIVAPPNELLESFREMSSLTFDLAQQQRIEGDKLAELRDYLLPKLLSGELRVKDAVNTAEGLL